MKILILEDEDNKFKEISNFIQEENDFITIIREKNYRGFAKSIERELFDLILIDLFVPLYEGTDSNDQSIALMEDLRDTKCINCNTEVIALTQHDDSASDHIKEFNYKHISVLIYSEDKKWKETLSKTIKNLNLPNYDFVIICALDKEKDAYSFLNNSVTDNFTIKSFDCKGITLNNYQGVIIKSPRMGLVDAAITTSRAIEIFKPKIVCMSGICASVDNSIKIYDLIIPDVCYQHDSGKWVKEGLIPEPYSVQLDHKLSLEIKTETSNPGFVRDLQQGIILRKSEMSDEELNLTVHFGVASSGNTVIADEFMNEIVKDQHRKLLGFDMENYAIYESARLADNNVKYFSVKSVVDNGSPSKGDNYHRVACLLSAKATIKLLEKILLI